MGRILKKSFDEDRRRFSQRRSILPVILTYNGPALQWHIAHSANRGVENSSIVTAVPLSLSLKSLCMSSIANLDAKITAGVTQGLKGPTLKVA